MKRDRRKGQSILEYTLLLGAIIAVVVAVLLTSGTGVKSKVQNAYQKFGNTLDKGTADLTNGVFQN